MSGCSVKTVVEAPPPCPEPSEAVLERIEADPVILGWYWYEFDPYCEALARAGGMPDAE